MKTKQIVFISGITALLVALDQITKVLASAFIQPVIEKLHGGKFIPVLGDFFTLNYDKNPGAFLGLGNNLTEIPWVLLMVVLPLGILTAVAVYFIRRPKDLSTSQTWMGILLFSGGIGNLIDRIAFGQVTDFMNLGIGPYFRSGIFNVADLYMVALVILVFFTSFGGKKKAA